MDSLLTKAYDEMIRLRATLIVKMSSGGKDANERSGEATATLQRTIDLLETQILGLLRDHASDILEPLNRALASYSRPILTAVPAHPSGKNIFCTPFDWNEFLAWAEPEDLKIAGDRGLSPGGGIERVFKIGQTEKAFEDAYFQHISSRAVLGFKNSVIWMHFEDGASVGTPKQLSRLLTQNIDLFPNEMGQYLEKLVLRGSGVVAQILYRAGARLPDGKTFNPPSGNPSGEEAFLKRCRSHHGLMEIMMGDDAETLIAQYQKNHLRF